MLERNSILYKIYNGESNIGELKPVKSTEQSPEKKKFDVLYELLLEQLPTEQQKLLDELLIQKVIVDCFYEEDKFRQGFVFGTRLMLETLQDDTYDK